MIEHNIHLVGTGFAGLVHAFVFSQNQKIIWHGPEPTPSPHNKQFLLSPYSLKLLQSIQHFEVKSTPIKTVDISHASNQNHLRFSCEDLDEEALSLSIKEHDLFEALLNHIQFENIERNEGHFDVKKLDNKHIHLFADGVYSPSSLHFKIPAKQIHDLKITQFQCSSRKQFDHKAWMRFSPRGVWAAVHLENDKIRLIYSSKPFDAFTPTTDQAKEIWEPVLGPLTFLTDPVSFPLQTRLNAQAHRDSCLWLGDSAVSLPPVGAQGLNLICRGAYILHKLTLKHSWNDVLKHYQQLRQPVHEQKYKELMTLIQGGHWVEKIPTCLTSIMMRAGNSSLWLKRQLVTQGWGINEPLPTL